MALLIKLVLSATGEKTLRQFRHECGHPLETQQRLLLHYMRKNANSAFGKAHGFARIRSIEDYQKAVPITSYEDIFPYIDAAMHGKPAQLTVDEPVLFASTSGTTDTPKYIPITRESRTAKSKLMRIWLSALHRDYPSIFDGRIMAVVSPEVEEHAPCGIPCGAESGHGYKNMPSSIRPLYSVPYETYEIDDYEGKYYSLLRIAAAQSLRLIYTCNPSTILLLAKRLGEFGGEIVEDVRRGGLSEAYTISDEHRKAMAPYLRPNPRRADELQAAMEKGRGVLLPRHVWPDMPVMTCWKGGTVGSFTKQFDDYFTPGLPVRDIGYLATELRGSVPLSSDGNDGVLAISTNFTEFFPATEDRAPEGHELLTVNQLEVGQRYYIYPSTHAGLCRYDMNDIIEVTGFHENAPMIRFIQKGKGVVSFTGEKLYEAQVIDAVHEALASRQGRFEFIVALGEMHEDFPRYVFLVEFHDPVTDEEGRSLLAAIEEALRNHNVEYGTKRKGDRIGPPVLRAVPTGSFEAYRKRRVAAGGKDGQFKTLRLTTDESFAREFPWTREFVL